MFDKYPHEKVNEIIERERMKTLTKEAKIHLATVVDDWQIVPVLQAPGYTYLAKEEETDLVQIEDYEPNDHDSPYCMKYLRGIIVNLVGTSAYQTVKNINLTLALGCLDELIEDICKNTGFKSEVWE